MTTAGEHFLRDQDRERGADGATDDADGSPGQDENIKLGVIAGPRRERR
jgi:hypothetical protein